MLQRSVLCVFLVLVVRFAETNAQQYVQYERGTLNLVLAAPHGGLERPEEIKNRTAGCYFEGNNTCVFRHDCGTPNYTKCPVTIEHDSYTMETANKLREFIFQLTGKYPYLVANKLHRIKLDPNREINEATFGEPLAVATYEYYHGMIRASMAEIANSSQYESYLVLDVHGQSHSHNLTELGYDITSKQLDSGTYDLKNSTVQYAASKLNYNNSIIIGDVSLGHFIEQQTIKCLPSPTNPTISGRQYFDGGYTVYTHSSNSSDAIQLEIARIIRFASTPADFDANMQKLSRGIANFLEYHYKTKSTTGSGSVTSMSSHLLLLSAIIAILQFDF